MRLLVRVSMFLLVLLSASAAAAIGTYEAEDCTSRYDCRDATDHAGYTGPSFVDYLGVGAWIEWDNIEAQSAGEHLLKFRYGNGSPRNRRTELKVNGTDVGIVEFPPTGSWKTWGYDEVTVSLNQGLNTIRLDSIQFGPNLDHMTVTSLVDPVEDELRCAQVPEHELLSMSCPQGQTITSIEFASYGTPEGACSDGFVQGICHSANSRSVVEAACLDYPSCSVRAKNSVFGDPCHGTFKRLWVLYTCGGDDPDPVDPDPVKVFILAGQSNMVGFGTVDITQAMLDRNGGMGTLEYLVEDPATAATFEHLGSPGDWTVRDDVWLVDFNYSGPLAIHKSTYGPELQFGHVMGDHYDEPVLLIKIAWGGKSLYVDFRPPSSGGQLGPYYTLLVDRVNEVLGDLEQFWPGYQGQGYEVVGFGWHQGWNDRVNQAANDEYQTNCVNFINDIRAEFNLPDMPFVLATTGMSGWDETHPRALSLMEAQLAVPTDPRLLYGDVFAVETRGFYRAPEVSPSSQGYHWNRNAETYFLIGNGMAEALIDQDQPVDSDARIDAVYMAQTHVLPPGADLFKLVSDREALIKLHVVADGSAAAPPVTARLRLNGGVQRLILDGPDVLPTEIPDGPGVVDHKYEDSFTARIPAGWVQPGLEVDLQAGNDSIVLDDLKIGAPNRLILTMFDMHYFQHSPGDYAAGWFEELQAKWPTAGVELRRIPDVIFEELVIPPRADLPAARVSSKDDYFNQTGQRFDGEQAAALQWLRALQGAAGIANRTSVYYINIHGVHSGGQGGGYGAVGNGRSYGILHHELGHAFSVPDNCNVMSYPYRGDMYGIPAGEQFAHVGPTWGFDLPSGRFITPVVQPGADRGIVGTYKADPMCGGGMGKQNNGFLYRYYSDYNLNKIQKWLEKNVTQWSSSLQEYVRWDDSAKDYSAVVGNDGVRYPVQRDVQVISVMAGVSAASPDAIMVYPPIGPYLASTIDLFDPRVASDRTRADQIFCPGNGCDVSLRITQGGQQIIAMLAIDWNPSADPLHRGSYKTRAVNLLASEGSVTKAELLLTPDAEKQGLPANPTILDTWN